MTVDTTTGEVTTVLDAARARALTDRIRQTLTVAHDLIIEAFQGRAWTALGYESWDAYCAGEFGDARMVRLEREQRREIVAEMRQVGMSTRAIASGLGVPQKTVARDTRSGESNDSPAPVIGIDGKTYAAPPYAPPSRPTRPDVVDAEIVEDWPAVPPPATARGAAPRRPIPDAFFDAAYDLVKAVERIQRLADDDRFPRNAEQVAAKHRSDLTHAVDALSGVLHRLPSA